MAKTLCALCGTPLSMFGKKELVCCGEPQVFCADCHEELFPITHVERTRILLERGRNPVNVESMRKVLTNIETKEEAKRKAESTDLKCVRCGAPMAKMGRKKFQMGEEGFFIDSHMWEGSLELDVLRCTSCRKVEFFLPEEGKKENPYG